MEYRQKYANILKEKFIMIEFSLKKLKESKEKYWEETEFGMRAGGENISISNEEVQFYAEAYFYQVKSFLDIFMKYLLNKNKKIYFNRYGLKEIVPQTKYIKSLLNYWNNGLKNKKYSLDNFNTYRNFICHEISLNWFNGQINSDELKWYVLPDNPRSKNFRFNKDLNLFDFCDEIHDILKEMIKNFDLKTEYRHKKKN